MRKEWCKTSTDYVTPHPNILDNQQYNDCNVEWHSNNNVKDTDNTEDMGFAGIIACAGNIIGFADKKSRIVYDKITSEYIEQSEPQKLFHNDSFVACFSGINSIMILDNGTGKKLYLADYIEKEMENCEFPSILFSDLLHYVRDNSVYPFDNIYMNAGMYSEYGNPVLIQASFSSNSCSYQADTVNGFKTVYSGYRIFTEYYNEDQNRLMMTDEKKLEEELKSTYRKIKNDDGYCPVGEKWDIWKMDRK